MPLESKVRRVGRPKGMSLSQDFGVAAREALAGLSSLTFPCARYQDDILGFAKDVLGYTPCFTLEELVAIRDDEDARGVPEHERLPCLWPKQVEILVAIQDSVNGKLVNDHGTVISRVSISSGHKISKSHTAGIAGLWFYSCFDDAKVVFSSTTFHQVKTILWDEFRKIRHRSRIVIPGDMHTLPSSGFISEDFRSARGFTAKEPEAVAGISGKNLLFILDEASGIPDEIHEAVKGNMAGGATVVMFSNPTRTIGTFFDSFNSKADFHCTFQVSSEETPNAQTGRRLIPGLATKEYVDEMREEWGEDSPFYLVRVKGLFVLNDDAKPFSLALLQAAEERWLDEPAEGRLHIGCDPAGPGSGGDETAYCVRRGNKVLELFARQSQTETQIIQTLEDLLARHKRDRELDEPVIAIDREGPIGYKVWSIAKTAFEGKPVRILGLRASDRARRQPHLYHLLRDELWGNLQQWLKQGGTLPQDTKLEKELNCIEWTSNLKNQLKATDKDDIRKLIGRSPDRADALCLAAWEIGSDRISEEERSPAPPPAPTKQPIGIDPYAGTIAIDPYANL